MKSTYLLLTAALAASYVPTASAACGDTKYIAEVFVMGANFCPRGSVPTDGRLLPISQNNALFSLLGTNFGGDGRTTFGVPDLRGRAAVGEGQGPGLATKRLGYKYGSENVTLSVANMPTHNHAAGITKPHVGSMMEATTEVANTSDPAGNYLANSQRAAIYRTAADTTDVEPMATSEGAQVTVGNSGGNQSFSVQSPVLGMTSCMCTVGLFPSRN